MVDMILVKAHNTGHGVILAMCDKDLEGTVIASGKLHMDLSEKYIGFYKGECVSPEKAGEIASKTVSQPDFNSANAVGKESVGALIQNNLATPEAVRKIKDVPFVQVYRVDLP